MMVLNLVKVVFGVWCVVFRTQVSLTIREPNTIHDTPNTIQVVEAAKVGKSAAKLSVFSRLFETGCIEIRICATKRTF